MHYADGSITGARARCLALLQCLRKVIETYVAPPEKSFARDLTARINTYVQFLIDCRPLSVSMGNAVKSLKQTIAELGVQGTAEPEAKAQVLAHVDRYIAERIVSAEDAIVKLAMTTIKDGDVILTHAHSHIVTKILEEANKMAVEKGWSFRVVVVDSRPSLEGRKTLRRLLQQGISCTYTHLGAVSYAMREVTKVFLGAAAVMANGTMLSRLVRKLCCTGSPPQQHPQDQPRLCTLSQPHTPCALRSARAAPSSPSLASLTARPSLLPSLSLPACARRAPRRLRWWPGPRASPSSSPARRASSTSGCSSTQSATTSSGTRTRWSPSRTRRTSAGWRAGGTCRSSGC